MIQELQDITGINSQALEGAPLTQFTINERISWTTPRNTKREEDKAYSLLGIFDIHIPLIYGEGQKKAFVRLNKAIEESPARREEKRRKQREKSGKKRKRKEKERR